MRLIDADKLNRDDLCNICKSADCSNCFADEDMQQWIDKQPTVYDIDKVVEQLEERLEEERMTKKIVSDVGVGLEIAIEIVKGGIVNGLL